MAGKQSLPDVPRPLTAILTPQDVIFLNTCSALMRQDVDAAASWLDQLSLYVHTFPVVYQLLQARLHRLTGKQDLAIELYRQVNAHFPFVLDEMYS
jgi:hypothetical protein